MDCNKDTEQPKNTQNQTVNQIKGKYNILAKWY